MTCVARVHVRAAEPSEEHLVENGAHSNQAVIVRHLLEAGAEPSLGRTHAPDNNVALGTTAFHYGAMSNDAEHLKALRLLLDECSSCVDIEDEEGLTPLSLSAMHDSPRAFKMLLAYNASTMRLVFYGVLSDLVEDRWACPSKSCMQAPTGLCAVLRLLRLCSACCVLLLCSFRVPQVLTHELHTTARHARRAAQGASELARPAPRALPLPEL